MVCREISYLYTQQSVDEAMDATADVMQVKTRDLESIFSAFVQG